MEEHGFERIETGQLVDTYARSKFEETRRKAQKFGARGTTLKAYKRIGVDQASVLDPEGAHFAALQRVADFADARVLEPGGRIQIADVTIQNPVSEEGKRDIDLWTG